MSNLLEDLLGALAVLPEDKRAEIEKAALDYTAKMLWVPNPGPQTEARASLADELLLGGSAGGGKSSFLVGSAIQDHHRSIIFRRTFPQIKGLIAETQRILGSRDGYNSQEKEWKIPGTNKVLEFGSCLHEDDKEEYQGRAHDLKAFDEITHFTESQYRYLITWCRSADEKQRCRTISTCNPPERPEQMWVLNYWGAWLNPMHPNPAKPGELRWYTTSEDGKDIELLTGDPILIKGEWVTPKSRTFIPASVRDNPEYMRSGYMNTLNALPEDQRKRMRDGIFTSELKDHEWQLLPTDWVRAAQERWTEEGRKSLMTCMGVDVAQGGEDKTVLARRHGSWIDEPKVYPGKETPDGPSVAALVVKYRRDRCDIRVDKGGGWGGSAIDTLKGNETTADAIRGVNPSEASQAISTDGASYKFFNLRAEMFWKLREALAPENRNPLALPPGQSLFSQLCSIRYQEAGKGIIKVELKADIIKRIGHSPDEADAIALTCMASNKAHEIAARSSGLKGRPVSELPKQANLGYSKFKARYRTNRSPR